MYILEGYSASIFIGFALGLIGGGGSILTVPVLVYLFQVDALLATTYSLFIVGTTSTVGTFSYFRKGLVDIKTTVVFGLPSIAAVFLTRGYVLPVLPEEMFHTYHLTITKSVFLLLLFALLMILASYSMIRKSKVAVKETTHFNYPILLAAGAIVGTFTGLVGAGGGFLIIPSLIWWGKLSMKKAIGTSLVIISVNSLIGFSSHASEIPIDWTFLGKVTAIAVLGMFLGMALSSKVEGTKLKPAFGWFVLIMGIYILLKETWLK